MYWNKKEEKKYYKMKKKPERKFSQTAFIRESKENQKRDSNEYCDIGFYVGLQYWQDQNRKDHLHYYAFKMDQIIKVITYLI